MLSRRLDFLRPGEGTGSSQALHYIEPDALGSPRVVIDPQRDVAVWKWNLTGEAFGATVPNEDPDTDGTAFVLDMRYPGQRYDAASGLNYNYFRDYDPASGRYVESDPIGLAGGVSTFGYASLNPNAYIDPLGLLVYRVNGVVYQQMFNKQITMLYPGGPAPKVKSNTNGRTALDWNIKARCICEGGSYRLDEFEVDITP